MRKELGIKINKSLNDLFQKTFDLQRKSGIYNAIFSEALCVVSKYPKKVHRNESFDLHNIDGVAVEWGSFGELTRFDSNFVNGIFIPSDLFSKVLDKSITVEEFFKIPNEEHKSGVISLMQEKFGDTYLFDFLSEYIGEIDSFTNNKDEMYLEGTTKGMNIGVYTLFKGNISGTDIAYVRCYCPSTDRMFFLGVEPKHTNAKDAIASLYRVPRKLKGNIKYIQRQGQRFSTVFDELGTNKLKDNVLSKEDIQDTVSISGDEYFGYMRYEY